MSWKGELLHIHIADAGSRPMRALDETRLVPGLGIEGDRYAKRNGTYSDRHNADREVTLMEFETLEALARDHGIALAAHEHRRNNCRIERGGTIRPGAAIERLSG